MAKEDGKIIRRRLRNAYASGIISISLVLLLIGVASLLAVNARSVSDYFKENLGLSVILDPEVSDDDAGKCCEAVSSLPFVKKVRLVTREEGAAELREMLGEDFLSVFSTSPVPVSLELTLCADYVSPDSIAVVRKALGAVPHVDDVEYQQSLVEKLNSNLARISLVLGVFILLLLFISYVLINNTVRISVFSRRFTIHTMQLVGATRAFIRRPFTRAAVVQGLLSALIALTGLAAGLFLLSKSFPQLFAVITTSSLVTVGAVVVASGVLICVVSTYFVVNRLVGLGKDDLYF